MLIRVLREALRTLRAAGWPAFGLAVLYLGALAIIIPAPGPLLFIGISAQNVVTFALVRYLAARRGTAPKGDGPPMLLPTGQPKLLPTGQPKLPPRRPGPVSDADRRAGQALRNAGFLARSAMRLALVQLLGALGIVLLLVAVGGSRVLPDSDPSQAQIVRLLVGLVPVAALISAFVALAPQRIAIEGDPRVILAVLQSIRIARTSYGTLFALSLIEPLLFLAEVAADHSLPVRVAVIAAHPLLHLLVVAACNAVYAAAPSVVPAPGRARS